MSKLIEIRKALVACEKQITDEVKKGSNRNRVKIREHQVEHDKLTRQLADALKDNREQPKDKSDDSGEEFRKEQEEKQRLKRAEFEKQGVADNKENEALEKKQAKLEKSIADFETKKEEFEKEQAKLAAEKKKADDAKGKQPA